MGGFALLRARMKGGEGRPARVRPVTTLPCGGGGGGGGGGGRLAIAGTRDAQ